MGRKFICLLLFALATISAMGADTLYVWRSGQPVVMERRCNIVLDLRCKGKELTSLSFQSDAENGMIKRTELYYTGTASMLASRTTSTSLLSHRNIYGGGQKLYADPGYAVLKASSDKCSGRFDLSAPLHPSDNYFYLSVEPSDECPLDGSFDIRITGATINGKEAVVVTEGPADRFRFGVSVRDAGQDGVFGYRIPGIVTANDGTLVSVFDIRRSTTGDLQENIQIGVCRSHDGGRHWDAMQTAMDMRSTGFLPDSQNGTGDPSILVDPSTGYLYIMALWTHGIGGATSWGHCRQGITPEEGAAQVLVIESHDNGATWSAPYNITPQIKDSSWFILLQGPGRGIAMQNGTLVFPFQYKDSRDMPAATIVYSKDKGKTWTVGARARENTTEAQVVELADGSLMLNMRDNRGGSRAVTVTSDMGKTWTEHPSSRSALQEPVCMASLIRVKAEENSLGRDILFFSNPNSTTGRNHITIKASLDGGLTWKEENSVMLDAENGWGYSCLTMIDQDTIGILYESSKAHLLFQAIKIDNIVKTK